MYLQDTLSQFGAKSFATLVCFDPGGGESEEKRDQVAAAS